MQKAMQRILCFLSINPQYNQFAIPQLKSILHDCPIPQSQLFQQQLQGKNINHPYEINKDVFKRYPMVVLNVPDFEQHHFEKVCRESVMVHKMIQLISVAPTYQQLVLRADQDLLQKHCRNEEELVMCDFYSRNRSFQREDQVKKIHRVLADLDVRGHVNFKTPKIRYQLIELHEWYQKHHLEAPEKTLQEVYFGMELCNNHIGTLKFNGMYELNKRVYLGPTSTFNDLAFLMCNQALITPGSTVLDPFVGTGGLLIPPASRQALVFGSDLDIRVLNGYSVGRINKNSPYYHADKKLQVFTPKINLNFQQYGLPIPNIFRIDSTKLGLKAEQFFDAIITDPPYGIRAMSRSVTKKNQVEKEEPEEAVQEKQMEEDLKSDSQTEQKIEQKSQKIQKPEKIEQISEQRKRRREKKKILKENRRKRYQMLSQEQKQFKQKLQKKMNKERVEQWQKFDRGKIESTEREKIFEALLNVGRKYLRKKGRLVFLYPIYEEEQYVGAKNIPSHEGFRLIDLSENKMSRGNSRILVTLQRQ